MTPNLEITQIDSTDIQDAWFQCISKILDVGFRYEIQHGSYVEQTRHEFDQVVITIKHPYSEPYDTMLPQIPTRPRYSKSGGERICRAVSERPGGKECEAL